jgi:hypothetical protein
MVAMFRSCGDALCRSASAITGKRETTASCAAVSLIVAPAPMNSPSRPSVMRASGSRRMSRTRRGAMTSSFSRSTSVVPPAR